MKEQSAAIAQAAGVSTKVSVGNVELDEEGDGKISTILCGWWIVVREVRWNNGRMGWDDGGKII